MLTNFGVFAVFFVLGLNDVVQSSLVSFQSGCIQDEFGEFKIFTYFVGDEGETITQPNAKTACAIFSSTLARIDNSGDLNEVTNLVESALEELQARSAVIADSLRFWIGNSLSFNFWYDLS